MKRQNCSPTINSRMHHHPDFVITAYVDRGKLPSSRLDTSCNGENKSGFMVVKSK